MALIPKIPAHHMAVLLDRNLAQEKSVDISMTHKGGLNYSMTISFGFAADIVTQDEEQDPGNENYATFGDEPGSILKAEYKTANVYFRGSGTSTYLEVKNLQSIESVGDKVRSIGRFFSPSFAEFAELLKSFSNEQLETLKTMLK